MPTDRTILIAGAGIGGLTAALALSRAGFQVVVFEAARHLSEIGAGIQLSPNAVHVLRELGIAERLAPDIVAPTAVRVRSARSGRDIARIPLGTTAEARYGAPYWIVHRAHLQRALLAAIEGCPDAILRLGVSVLDVARHEHGVTIAGKTANGVGHGPDRRRRRLVEHPTAPQCRRRGCFQPPHRVARAHRRGGCRTALVRSGNIALARARRASRPLSRLRRQRAECRRHRQRRCAAQGLGGRGRTRCARRPLRALAPRCAPRHRTSGRLADVVAVRPARQTAAGPRRRDPARRRGARDAAFRRAG
ncbi:MAG: FAD-dependent monooxygenase, partial [Rhizobiales bacterium]|nr:FAD-dependent monooxygenase [Hyphomicrobiales bacterium]